MDNRIFDKVVNAMLSMQRYSWEQGVAAQSLYEAGLDDLVVTLAHDAVVRQASDGRLAVVGENNAINDPGANGEPVWRAYEITGDEFYKNGCDKMMEYLMMYAPRTEDGVVFHNSVTFDERYSNKQIWVDGCYMVPPFLAMMGEFTEATKQFGGYYNFLADEKTGLFFHIYDVGTGSFVRKKLWATGNGWALLGTARMITEAMHQNEIDIAKDLIDAGRALLESMLNFQRDDGLFHDVVDDPTSFVDGTAAMMTAAFMYRGLCEGWLGEEYKPNADAVRRVMQGKVDRYGIVRGVCGAPYFDREGTSVEAQAAYIMMEAWKRKADCM